MESICPQKRVGVRQKEKEPGWGGLRVSGKGIALRVSITNIPRAANTEQQAKLRLHACMCVYVS